MHGMIEDPTAAAKVAVTTGTVAASGAGSLYAPQGFHRHGHMGRSHLKGDTSRHILPGHIFPPAVGDRNTLGIAALIRDIQINVYFKKGWPDDVKPDPETVNYDLTLKVYDAAKSNSSAPVSSTAPMAVTSP